VQLDTTPPAALLGKVPTIGAVEELGSKEGQGVSKVEAPQQQAVGLALAEMGSLPGLAGHTGQLESNDPRDVGLAKAFQQSRRNYWKKLHRWEFADLAELHSLRANEMYNPEPDPQHFIILPG